MLVLFLLCGCLLLIRSLVQLELAAWVHFGGRVSIRCYGWSLATASNFFRDYRAAFSPITSTVTGAIIGELRLGQLPY